MLAALAAEPKPEFGSQRSEVGNQKPELSQDVPEDAGEDAAVATTTETTQSNEANGAPPPPDDEGFVWPEGSAPNEAMAASDGASEDERVPETPLPSVDELVKRIPAATRETLDELFRVRFVGVKRVDKSALKN